METINIPIYRAKKIDSDEYIEGELHTLGADQPFITTLINDRFMDHIEIDQSTLAIHFPDTQTKELFFGLDNGKGASIIEALFIEDNTPFKGVAMHTHYGYVFYDKNDDWVHITKLKDIKIIGIQK